MPNVAKVLKEEISRVARREIRAATAPLRSSSVAAKHAIASLKRQVAQWVTDGKQMQADLARLVAAAPAATQPEAETKARITAKGMRSLRNKLRLSVSELARLLGVTDQAVRNWEKSSGAIRVRETTRKAVLAIRDLGVREAKKLLGEKAKSAGRAKPAKRAKAGKRAKPAKPGRPRKKAKKRS